MGLTAPGLELPLQQEGTTIMMPAGVVFCRGCWKTAITIVLVLSVGGAPLNAKGKTEKVNEPQDYTSGLAAGQRDAKRSGVWVLSGLNLGATRLILPWVIGTEVPGGNLVGRSAKYVGGYVDKYKSKAKPRNFQYSLAGVAVTPSNSDKKGCNPNGPSFDKYDMENCLDCGCQILDGLSVLSACVPHGSIGSCSF